MSNFKVKLLWLANIESVQIFLCGSVCLLYVVDYVVDDMVNYVVDHVVGHNFQVKLL